MADKSELGIGLPSGAFITHDSFGISLTEAQSQGVYDQIVAFENESFLRTVRAIQKLPHSLNLLKPPPDTKLTAEQVELATLIETATLYYDYPQFVHLAVQAQPLYRISRAAEMTSKFQRGGNSVIIGSGLMVDEIVALYTKPPTFEDAHRLRYYTPNAGLIRSNTSHPLPLLDGTIIGIEPEPPDEKKLARICEGLGISTEMFTIHKKTLGKAVQDKDIPEDLDLLVLPRVDPEIFFPDGSMSKRQKQEALSKALDILTSHLRSGGSFLLTVGLGKNKQGGQDRKQLILNIMDLLPRHQMEVNRNIPHLFTPSHQRSFVGGETNTVGCIAAVKK